jgi:hypothetical protein
MAPPTYIGVELACAYCFSIVKIQIGSLTLRGPKGDDPRVQRSGKVCSFKCPHCDSTIALHMATKRSAKGKRRIAQEAAAKADYEAKYRVAQEHNNLIGAALLAQPGCTCAASIASDGKYGRGMHREGDHPLVSSWTYNMPNEPRHRHQCPLRGSVAEAALLDSFAHNAKTGAA